MKYVTAGEARIPALGFGTWRLRGAEATDMVARALAEGWRHVDTARMYGNEAEVGAGIRAAAVPRDQVFLTTKIWPDDHAPDRLRAAAEDSAKTLGVGVPDLVLLHWPSRTVPLEETVPALCALVRDGLARHVGVSNFTRPLLEKAAALADVPLTVNQVEYHPWLDQSPMLAQLAAQGMALTAYVPLAKGRAAQDATLARIGAAHGVSGATACLAWLLARGAIAIPKTASPARLAENAAALDVTLSTAEIDEIAALAQPDGRLVQGPDGVAPDWD
ncbi:MAG: aldo/keto reductase [Pseudomonadota bacterium]|nr:aldo/keto reductase [Pseudomonadota bacterium]MEE3098371.1 aldo/keto reductase [Pseudomonadota bacterium]